MGKFTKFLNNLLSSNPRETSAPAKTEFGTEVGRQAAAREKQNEWDLAVEIDRNRKGG